LRDAVEIENRLRAGVVDDRQAMTVNRVRVVRLVDAADLEIQGSVIL
jgi:hypothetical protein